MLPPLPPACGLAVLRAGQILAEIRELFIKTAVENREAAPGFRVEVLIIQMERRGIPLALPLVAAPEAEKPLDPHPDLAGFILRKLRPHRLENFHRQELVAD